MRFLITAGPTREPLDDVRFLSNRSTGRMGYEVAAAAVRGGHRAYLVTGPVEIAPPEGIQLARVTTAMEMHRVVMERLEWADALVMAAAVSDFRPRRRIKGKRKKHGGEDEVWVVELVRNPDILASAGKRKGDRVHVGFAVESRDLLANARAKLGSKHADMIVANLVSAFGAERSTAHFLTPEGSPRVFKDRPKGEIADEIVKFCVEWHAERAGKR